MTHRGPFQPLPFCDSLILRPQPVPQTQLHGSAAPAAGSSRDVTESGANSSQTPDREERDRQSRSPAQVTFPSSCC